ncbi:MAG: biotin--[acetyl-CoA-carboxylase] ligase [Proteobacteria bacterium]|nr:biotin--[acetyl-CoA-carboxylase] ligase [Pseudomonadota bacterium]
MTQIHPKPLDEMVIHRYNWSESTQLEAKALFERGELRHGISIIADRQVAGYGKNGRIWHDEGGNVAITICLDSYGMESWQQLCFIAAVSVGNVLRKLLAEKQVDNAEVRYKWINDVILDDGKISGILLESLQNRFILVGIGVNNQSAPSIKNISTSKLADYVAVPADRIINLIHYEFMEQYSMWSQYGFIPIRNQWMASPYKFREVITVQDSYSKKHHKGTFIGIDREGNLELKREDGQLVRVSIGEML